MWSSTALASHCSGRIPPLQLTLTGLATTGDFPVNTFCLQSQNTSAPSCVSAGTWYQFVVDSFCPGRVC